MELHIFPDKFVIESAPVWVAVLLLLGLFFFFLSKSLRQYFKTSHKYSFLPGVVFVVSFVFLIGGINLFVYKIVFNKEGLIIFNIHNFNQQIKWSAIKTVQYQEQQKINILFIDTEQQEESVVLDLKSLEPESMQKVKILFQVKLRQNQ